MSCSAIRRAFPLLGRRSYCSLTDAFGRPVRSAEIHLIGGHGELVARTAADGRFAFSELPSGDYEVVVVLGGRGVAHLEALHLSAISSPSRLTLVLGRPSVFGLSARHVAVKTGLSDKRGADQGTLRHAGSV